MVEVVWRQRVSKGWAKAAGFASSGGNKFGARRTTLDGITFDSEHEARRYAALRIKARASLISDLQLQVRIPLIGASGPLVSDAGRALSYVCDFQYVDEHGNTILEDAKGKPTREYLLKKSIMRSMGLEIIEV